MNSASAQSTGRALKSLEESRQAVFAGDAENAKKTDAVMVYAPRYL